jgi:hypothetical protein
MIEPQPSIYLLGIRIDEPIATLTDVILSLVCFFAFYNLNRKKLPGRSQLYFRYYFLLMGIATLSGGVIGHGFLYALSFGWKLPGWIISMVSVSLIERSAIAHNGNFIKPQTAKFFMVLNVLELITIMAITMSTLNFKWVQFHSAYGLLVIVGSFHLYSYFHTRDKGSLILLVAIAITSCGSLVFVNKISIHTWFNYIDLSHLILAIAAYVFYQGALQLHKKENKYDSQLVEAQA